MAKTKPEVDPRQIVDREMLAARGAFERLLKSWNRSDPDPRVVCLNAEAVRKNLARITEVLEGDGDAKTVQGDRAER